MEWIDSLRGSTVGLDTGPLTLIQGRPQKRAAEAAFVPSSGHDKISVRDAKKPVRTLLLSLVAISPAVTAQTPLAVRSFENRCVICHAGDAGGTAWPARLDANRTRRYRDWRVRPPSGS